MYGSDLENTGAVFLGDDVDVNKVVSLLETIEDLQILRELCFCLRLMTYGYGNVVISITLIMLQMNQNQPKYLSQILLIRYLKNLGNSKSKFIRNRRKPSDGGIKGRVTHRKSKLLKCAFLS
jgi:hypothetical protein